MIPLGWLPSVQGRVTSESFSSGESSDPFGEGASLIQGGPESKVSYWSGGESLASHWMWFEGKYISLKAKY